MNGTKSPVCLSILALFITCVPFFGAEVTTNGTGGGPWSEAATWRGGAVPKAEDEVTVRKGDAVTFDRNDDGKTTCAKLFIDPRGGLKFKTGMGKVIFVVSGPVESFGMIRLDGTTSADDHHELRLTGKTPAERIVKTEKGCSLIVVGKPNLPGNRRNALLVSKAPDPKAADITGKIEVKAGILDVRHAEVRDLMLSGNEIDNTGAKAGERCNVLGNRFMERSNVYLATCDTPQVVNNQFEYTGGPWHQPAAIYLSGCPLAEVKNNTIKGFFYYAISLYACTDCVVTGNVSEKCHVGYYCVGTAMFKGNTIREAGTGFVVTSMSGTLDETVFEKTTWGVHLSGASIQMASTVVKDPPKDFKMIDFVGGDVTLLNCNCGPEMIQFPKVLPKSDKPLVTAMQFLVLKVNGELKEDSQVEVRTTNPIPPLAPGAMDLNIRNAPAPLVGNRTPLPQSLSPLILRSWVVDKDGKNIAAPDYTVRILGPAEGEKPGAVLKTLSVKPDAKWFRPKPNDPAPTLEVNLK